MQMQQFPIQLMAGNELSACGVLTSSFCAAPQTQVTWVDNSPYILELWSSLGFSSKGRLKLCFSFCADFIGTPNSLPPMVRNRIVELIITKAVKKCHCGALNC